MGVVTAMVCLYKINLTQIKLAAPVYMWAGFIPIESFCQSRLQVFCLLTATNGYIGKCLMGVQHEISVLQYVALLAELLELFSKLC